MRADLPLCPPAVTDTAIGLLLKTPREQIQVVKPTGKSERHGLNASFFIALKRATFTVGWQCGGHGEQV
jgi:hypothetical protein